MAKVVSYTCDVCGWKKGEANHWFAVEVKQKRPAPDRGCESHRTLGQDVFAIHPWENRGGDMKHCCSRECVQKLMTKWMDSLPVKLEYPCPQS